MAIARFTYKREPVLVNLDLVVVVGRNGAEDEVGAVLITTVQTVDANGMPDLLRVQVDQAVDDVFKLVKAAKAQRREPEEKK